MAYLLLSREGARRNGKSIFSVLAGPISARNCHILNSFRQLATKPNHGHFFGAAEWLAMGTHKGCPYGLADGRRWKRAHSVSAELMHR